MCTPAVNTVMGGLVLETTFTTPGGTAALIDFMVPEDANSTLVRIVEGRTGHVDMVVDLAVRFDYGQSVPWASRPKAEAEWVAIAGPELVVLRADVELEGHDMRSGVEFTISPGERVSFVLRHGPSHLQPPSALDAMEALAQTEKYWAEWSGRGSYKGHYEEAVHTSLLVLKALTYHPTGGIAAAATTSLPEQLGGSRNWDYRYCWLRDATLTLFSLMKAGYYDEAGAWRDWLHRSIAGQSRANPDHVWHCRGTGGWPSGRSPRCRVTRGAAPVRIGNAASEQLQLDVFGEVTEALHQARDGGLATASEGWSLQCAVIKHLEEIWSQPDEGIWETRGGRKHFTYSKVMAWVAFDRMIKDAEEHKLEGPVDHWATIRDEIRELVLEKGFHPGKNSFTQHFGHGRVGRQHTSDSLGGVPASRRPAGAGHHRRSGEGAAEGRLCPSLQHPGQQGWAAARRRGVPGLLVLVGR